MPTLTKAKKDTGLNANVRPGSLDVRGQQRMLFPFDAFEFDDPKWATYPEIRLKSPWTFGLTTSQSSVLNTFQEYFEYTLTSEFSSRWSYMESEPDLTLLSTSGLTGGKALQFGDNSGDDEGIYEYNYNIPFDQEKLYRVSVRVKCTAGSGTFYCGVSGIGADGTTRVNYNGSDTYASQHYIVASGESVGSSWTVYTGYIRGVDTAGSTSAHPDMNDPAVLHEDVRYIRPMFIVNYQNQAGTYILDSISIDIVPEYYAAAEDWTPSSAGLWATSTYIGYYNGSTWLNYMKNDGTGKFTGEVTITGGSGIASLSDAGALATADDLDDIGDGTTYAKVLATKLSAGSILLSEVTGDLDDVGDGSTYAKVLSTKISAGSILLSGATGDLDDISDGTSYVKTTPNEKSGAGYAYTGLDSSGYLVTKVLPGVAAAPSGAGLYLGSDYMGYYDGGAWKTYMRSNGDAAFTGTLVSATGTFGDISAANGLVFLYGTTTPEGAIKIIDSTDDSLLGMNAAVMFLDNDNGNRVLITQADSSGGRLDLYTDTGPALQTRLLGYGTSYFLNALSIGNSTVDSNQKLQVKFADDTAGAGVKFVNSDGGFLLYNEIATAGNFNGIFEGRNAGSNRYTAFISNGTVDTGSTAVMHFFSEINGGVIATRPLYAWYNYTTKMAEMDVNGNLVIYPDATTWAQFDNSDAIRGILCGDGCGLYGQTSAAAASYFTANAYYDGAWKYLAAEATGQLYISGQTLGFKSASSGSAGGSISWTTYMTCSSTILTLNVLLQSLPVYNQTTSDSANLVVSSGGGFYRSTSSAKYKENIQDLEDGFSKICGLTPRSFFHRGSEKNTIGFIAEEAYEIDPQLVICGSDALPEEINWNVLTTHLVGLSQNHEKRIQILEKQMEGDSE